MSSEAPGAHSLSEDERTLHKLGYAQVLFRELGVGHGEELLVPLGLLREIAKAKNGDRGGLGIGRWRGRQSGLGDGRKSEGKDQDERDR